MTEVSDETTTANEQTTKASDATQTWSGGCQCGAVRFTVNGPLGDASVCYCRMCQKATGGPFGLYVRVEPDRLTWTRGKPKLFASSNVAHRGFCADCGTPLTWEYEGGLDLTVAAFDKADEIEPVIQMSFEDQFPWLWRLDAVAVRDTVSDPEYATFLASVRSFQHPDHDTETWPPPGGTR
jgi:hypothetical protein